MKRKQANLLILVSIIWFFVGRKGLSETELPWHSEEIKSFLKTGSNVFMLSDTELFCIDGNECKKLCNADGIDMLVPSDMDIYGFNKNEQCLFRLNESVWEPIISLSDNRISKEFEIFESNTVSYESMTVCRGKLFLLCSGQAGVEREQRFVSLSLDYAKLEGHACQDLIAFTLWNDNCLLFYRAIYNQQGISTYRLSTYDVLTGKENVFFEFEYQLSNIAVVQEREAIYYVSFGEVFELNKGEEPVRIGYIKDHYLGVGPNVFSMCQISDDKFVTFSPDGSVFVDDISLQQSIETIRIAGGVKDDVYDSFAKKHPNTRVITDVPAMTASEIYVDIETGRNLADIYMIDISEGYQFLKEKGYLGTIESSPIIDSIVKTYYEQIQEVIYSQNGLVAIPQYFSLNTWTVNETLWNKCIPSEPIPSTFSELLQFVIRWDEEYAEQFPEVLPLEFGGDTLDFLIEIVREYIFQYANNIDELTFDTQVFRTIMEMAKTISLEKHVSEKEIDQFNRQEKLLSMGPWIQYGIFYDEGNRVVPIAPMKIDETVENCIPVNMNVYILNPHSANRELANKYFEEVVVAQDPRTKAGMIMNWSEEVLSKRGSEKLEGINQKKQKILAEMKNADEDRMDELQLQFISLEEEFEDESLSAYLVSNESITLYQKLAAFMCIPIETPFYDVDGKEMQALEQIIVKYNEDRIDVDEFIREMERVLWMIKSE